VAEKKKEKEKKKHWIIRSNNMVSASPTQTQKLKVMQMHRAL